MTIAVEFQPGFGWDLDEAWSRHPEWLGFIEFIQADPGEFFQGVNRIHGSFPTSRGNVDFTLDILSNSFVNSFDEEFRDPRGLIERLIECGDTPGEAFRTLLQCAGEYELVELLEPFFDQLQSYSYAILKDSGELECGSAC